MFRGSKCCTFTATGPSKAIVIGHLCAVAPCSGAEVKGREGLAEIEKMREKIGQHLAVSLRRHHDGGFSSRVFKVLGRPGI